MPSFSLYPLPSPFFPLPPPLLTSPLPFLYKYFEDALESQKKAEDFKFLGAGVTGIVRHLTFKLGAKIWSLRRWCTFISAMTSFQSPSLFFIKNKYINMPKCFFLFLLFLLLSVILRVHKHMFSPKTWASLGILLARNWTQGLVMFHLHFPSSLLFWVIISFDPVSGSLNFFDPLDSDQKA